MFYFRHVEVNTGSGQFIFTIKLDPQIPAGCVGFSMPQRKWAFLSLNQEIGVRPYYFDAKANTEFLSNILLEADFMQKKRYIILL